MITGEQLQQVGGWLEQDGASSDLENDLRGAFPGLHFTFCDDDDVMSDHPVAAHAGYHLYLVDSSQHCLALTSDPETATGLVVAQVQDDWAG